MAVSIDLLNKKQITADISSITRFKGRPLDEFIRVTDVGKHNIKQLPRPIQMTIEQYIGNNKVDLFLRKK
jgi:hypothetical protein